MLLDPSTAEKSAERLRKILTREEIADYSRPVEPVFTSDRWHLQEEYIESVKSPLDEFAMERAIGTNDLLGMDYLWKALRAADAVARIQLWPTTASRGGTATGFMIAPGLFLTNWHVFKGKTAAGNAKAQFRFEADRDGRERPSTAFRIAPELFFVDSEDLDYCVVGIDAGAQDGPQALDSFGWLRLNPQLGKTDYGQFLSLIQHPSGQPKQIAIRENRLKEIDEASNYLVYLSDTFRGSSGSPAFNDFWDVVALHHSGLAAKNASGQYLDLKGNPIIGREPLESEVKWVANEGVRVSRIVADILARTPAGEHRDQLRAVFEGQLRPEAREEEEMAPPEIIRRDAEALSVGKRNALIVVPLNVTVTIREAGSEPVARAPVAETRAPDAGRGGSLAAEALNFDPDYDNRRGYDEAFLGNARRVPMPTIDPARRDQVAPTLDGGTLLDYHHFSVIMHKARRMAILAAVNVSYSKDDRAENLSREEYGKDEWIVDERMDDKYQIPKAFYDKWKLIDYGHLVRRDDGVWGSSAEESESSNADTFHLTNCTPQHEEFNRDMYGYHGLWGRLENTIKRQAEKQKLIARLNVLSGPVFHATKYLKLDDVKAPLEFWKVVVAPAKAGGLQAYGFIVSQAKDVADAKPFEDFSPTGFEEFQVSLAEIERRTLVRFAASLKSVDVMNTAPGGNEILPIGDESNVWHGAS